jgi:hypothetical protein
MGAPVTWPWCCTCSFKLFPCVDKDGKKSVAFALQDRLEEQATTFEGFNPEYTALALQSINRAIRKSW